jgi:multimeric flavodoxin WrbA
VKKNSIHRILGISASPRQRSNSDLLLREVIAAAEAAGAEARYISLNDYSIAPCAECGACSKTGRCRIDDDYRKIMAEMLAADAIVVATPVFFMAVCAQCKLLIDRCQCLWSKKYILKEPVAAENAGRRGMVIAVGGSKSKKMFESVRLTMKYFFDALEVEFSAALFVNRLEAAGEVLDRPDALEAARSLGSGLVGNGCGEIRRTRIVELA